MKRILKFVCPLLVIAILLSSCTFIKNEKILEQINTYLTENELNNCIQYVKGLQNEEKSAINDDVCAAVINKFNEFKNKTKIDDSNIFDLSLIDTAFAENCQKLWNIISEFSVDKESEMYNDVINLRYFALMIDYTRYCDIYSLMKKADKSGYLNSLSVALHEYNKNGDTNKLKLLFEDVKTIDYNGFAPQQYLVSDFKNAHAMIVYALRELEDGFSANDSSTVATAINSLKNALTDILYIVDTLTAVNAMQKTIYKKISTENIYAPFNSEVNVTKREFQSGMSFTLDSVFGGIEKVETNENVDSTTAIDNDKISKDEAIRIAVNAVNKTKSYTDNVNITLTQTRNIQLTGFDSDSTIADAENMTKSQLNQIITQSNGTGKKSASFSKGTDGTQTLNSFIPPSDKSASVKSDSVEDYTCVKGSGGYIVTLVLEPELVKSGSSSGNIGTLVNTFEFDNSSNVKKFDTSYSQTNVTVIVNNSGMLVEMEYTIDGISNCVFHENNTQNEYKAQFTFKNTYKYEFEY